MPVSLLFRVEASRRAEEASGRSCARYSLLYNKFQHTTAQGAPEEFYLKNIG